MISHINWGSEENTGGHFPLLGNGYVLFARINTKAHRVNQTFLLFTLRHVTQ